MGALASGEICGCLGGNDKWTTKPNTEYDTDESSSEEEITTDEETQLINKTNTKTKNKERDESYILYSDDEIDNKTKKSKKKEEEIIAQVQQSIMQISKNEVDKHSGIYGMDVKTMELLMNVNLNNQQPKPYMPSIASQPLTSMESVDYKQAAPIMDTTIDTTIDMSEQLKHYTSNDMISISEINSNHELEKEDSYNTLLVDDDNTPALPLNQQQNNNINERDRLQKSLGGLDYDFDNENANLEPLNTLRHDEKDIHDLRIKNIVLKANNSRGPDEIEELIKQEYTHKLHESHEEEITDDESSYEEHEKQEIERMKTEEMIKKSSRRQVSKAKLFRPNTVTPWHEDDIDDMHSAMTKEMESMIERQKSEETNKSPTINNNQDNIFDSDYDSEEEYDTINNYDIDKQIKIKSPKRNDNMNAGTKTSKLFRVKSTYKWDIERVEQENKDMQAQLANLMVAHQSSIDTDPGKQAKSLPFISGQ